MKKHNKNLEGAAKQAGVIQPVDYAIFMDHGYRGLYGGRARIFHTPRRRVGARGLQRRRALVGRVPPRGAPSAFPSEREMSGLGMRDIRERKPLRGKEHVLDHMGSTELAANLFCSTQTEEKLRRENVRNKDHASRIHNDVGRKVRQTIHELGGTMPENLPVAESIKKVESREKKRLRAEQKKALQRGPEDAP
jgi:DNA-damage-inducible protein D